MIDQCFQLNEDEELEDLLIFFLFRNWKQILEISRPINIIEGPIAMLSTSIDIREWFFMEEHTQSSLLKLLF